MSILQKLLEEIESMGRSEADALESRLELLLNFSPLDYMNSEGVFINQARSIAPCKQRQIG